MLKIKITTDDTLVAMPLEPQEKRQGLFDKLQWMLQPAKDLCDLYKKHNRHVAIIAFSTEEMLESDTSDDIRSPMVCNMTRTEFACGLAGAIYSYALRNKIPLEALLKEISTTAIDCRDLSNPIGDDNGL